MNIRSVSLIAITLVTLMVPPAFAERLITSLSSHQVLVSSSLADGKKPRVEPSQRVPFVESVG